MERKSIPEYETLVKFEPKICKFLSASPAIITPLAVDLRAAGIVNAQVAREATNLGLPAFTRANDLMTNAMATIESDPGKFETLLEKLSDHDLKKIVEKMQEHCETLGRSKKDTGKEVSQREPLDRESSQKGKGLIPPGALVVAGAALGNVFVPGVGAVVGAAVGGAGEVFRKAFTEKHCDTSDKSKEDSARDPEERS